jgi:2-hydroxycyclohexanecarboxyl-CoA dehydrogenase
MNLQLSGHQVAVFGSSSGIGRAIAQAFVEEGALVRGFDRTAPADAAPFATTLGDVTSLPQVNEFAAAFPTIDHVVFSVGAGSGKFGFPFWNLSPGDWARVLEINLIGAVNVAHSFAPKLVARGDGSVLLVASVAGQMGSQTDPPYSAAKAGLINFMQCAAKDFAPHGVRVNALAPGIIATPLTSPITSKPEWKAAYAARCALNRWADPSEMAGPVVFLASDASSYVTGTTLFADAGWTAIDGRFKPPV